MLLNQFLVSSVLVFLYAVTKVLSQIWGPPFARGLPWPGSTGALSPALEISMAKCSHREPTEKLLGSKGSNGINTPYR